ncbi:sodium/proton-translocating pyrophosphatase, partial [Verrucomicrobiota bacterium]
MNISILYFVLGVGVIALVFAWWKSLWVNRQDPGTEKMQEIGAAIREGAMAFLYREYKVLAIFVVVIAVVLVLINKGPVRLVAVSFVVGALCSGLSGFFGMRVATSANMRTTNAARKSLQQALQVAFSGGSVMGMCVVGLAVLGLASLTVIYVSIFGEDIDTLRSTVLPIISGFSLG